MLSGVKTCAMPDIARAVCAGSEYSPTHRPVNASSGERRSITSDPGARPMKPTRSPSTVRASRVTGTVRVSVPRSTVMLIRSPGRAATMSRTSPNDSILVSPTAATRSPGRRPATAAGDSGSTCPISVLSTALPSSSLGSA